LAIRTTLKSSTPDCGIIGMAATHQNHPHLSRWKRSAPIAGLAGALAVAAGGMIAFSGTAGEPIRFTRPKPQEKAPLRVNYSSDPAQAKEKKSIGLPQSSTGPRLPSTLSVNRKPREASRGRWETEGSESADDTAARARMEFQRWRMSAAENDRSSGKTGGGVFGENGAGGNQPPADNASPSRPPAAPGTDLSRSPLRGSASSPWGWNSQPAPGASSLRPEAPSLPSGLSPAPNPRPEQDSTLRSPGVGAPAQDPRPDWGVRQPRSFDLPSRPR
jgi:hypothetical protein